MAAAILRLQKEPSLCRALGRKGRQVVLEKYLRPTQAAKYLNLLSELCAHPEVVPSVEPMALRELAPASQSKVRAET
jgi:hypothetical protein